MKNNPRTTKYIPLIIAVSIIIGLVIGSFCANHFTGNRLNIINSSSNKVNDLIHIVNDKYVDTVNVADLVEKAMPKILRELDPHSSYSGAKDVERDMQDLKGSFSGIGVVFTIYDDTVRVIRIIPGGPSETVGLQAGDKIVSVDGKKFTGKIAQNDYVQKQLKGPKGTEVKVGVLHRGQKKQQVYTITRGDVPVKSILASYMLDEHTGYIGISNFGETTYPELLASLAKLNQEQFDQLIIDLRGNRGGLMAPAIRMANEFLPKGRLIVYTQGRKSPRSEYSSDGRGSYQRIPLCVLVDETSASASEIFSAAMQDNDRATIIGRRTFGKGLVQEPIQFSDGSMIRLTIARYYSASGRCLQKPYVQGEDDNYQMDLVNRAKNGEYISQDSIHLNGKKYKTLLGRTVYSEGGVMPDYFVPEDTSGVTSYYIQALNTGLMAKYAFIYLDNHRSQLNADESWENVVKYLQKQDIVSQFTAYASRNDLKPRSLLIRKSYKLLQEALIAYILDDIYGEDIRLMYLNKTDKNIYKAMEIFQKKQAFPQKPEEKSAKTAQLLYVGQRFRMQPHLFCYGQVGTAANYS